jgi:hypothetical protein
MNAAALGLLAQHGVEALRHHGQLTARRAPRSADTDTATDADTDTDTDTRDPRPAWGPRNRAGRIAFCKAHAGHLPAAACVAHADCRLACD